MELIQETEKETKKIDLITQFALAIILFGGKYFFFTFQRSCLKKLRVEGPEDC
jgi:hypothetical protein